MRRPRQKKRPPRTCLAPALAALLLVCACSDADPRGQDSSARLSSKAPLSQTHQRIVSGAPAPLETAVFFLEVTTPSGVATCSATLVTPDILLTAAHCISAHFGPVDCSETRLSEPLSVDHFRVSNEPDLTGAPTPSWTFPDIEQVRIVHEGELLCGHDVALLKLAAPLAGDVATPLDVPQEPLAAGETTSVIYRAIGYGSVHPSGTGEKVRRESELLAVQCASPDACAALILEGAAGAPNLPAPLIAAGEWLGQSAGCPGDSGGPALIDTDHGPATIGVLSRGHADCSLNIYSLPQSFAFREAVRDMMHIDGTGPSYQIPSWAVEPEEPNAPPGEGAAGGLGGMGDGGHPVGEELPETGGTLSASPADVVSWQTDPGCSCRLSGPAHGKASWHALFLLLISLSFWGARRRSAPAQGNNIR